MSLSIKAQVWGDLNARHLVEGAAGGFITASNAATVLTEASKYLQDAAECRDRAADNLGDLETLKACALRSKEAAQTLEQFHKWASHWRVDITFQISLVQALNYMLNACAECARLTRAQYMRVVAQEAGL